VTAEKKKRRAGYRQPGSSAATTASSDAAPRRSGPFASLLRSDPAQSPYPTLRSSFDAALRAVCGSPVIMGTIVLLVFGLRLALVALQVPARGAVFAATLALPPIGTVLDLQAAGTIFGDASGFVVAPAFLLVRSLVLAGLTGMIVEALLTGGAGRVGVLRGLRGFPPIFGIGVIELGAVFLGSLVIGFTGLGLVGVIVVLVATLFVFGYAPIVAVRDTRGLAWTARKTIRAARIPGSQNIFLALIYTVPSLLMLPVLIPSGQDIAANPSIGTWVGILLANVFHVVFLAVYCHRYLVAEAEIPDPPDDRRRR
jgi:hypothetical protein